MNFRHWTFGIAILAATYAYGDCSYTGTWDLTAGYRHDCFNWSIAGAKGCPHTLAEINWKNIHSTQVGTKWVLAGADTLYTRLEGSWAEVIQPDVIYRAFRPDCRETVREIFCRNASEENEVLCARGGNIFEAKWGIGAHLCSCPKRYDIAALVGCYLQKMNLNVRNPKLVFDDICPFNGITPLGDIDQSVCECIRCLSYRYRPCKTGGWAGLDGYFRIGRCLNLFVSYEFHLAAHRASGRWRWKKPSRRFQSQDDLSQNIPFRELREEFKMRWKECTTAWGNIANATLTYHTCDNWYFGVFAIAEYWRTRRGEYCPTIVKDTALPLRGAKVRLPTKTANLNCITWLTYYVGIDFQAMF